MGKHKLLKYEPLYFEMYVIRLERTTYQKQNNIYKGFLHGGSCFEGLEASLFFLVCMCQ